MTAPRGFARLTPAQRAEVSRKGGRAAQASGFANQFTKRSARAAGLKSAEKRAGSGTQALLDLMISVLDRLADGENFDAVVEDTCITARLMAARRGTP